MIKRELMGSLLRLSKQYPVVTVTGPRQSGKTSLVRAAFPNKRYVNLENPETRKIAVEDPRHFFDHLSSEAIIDEIQRVPDLFSYIQTIADEKNKPGLFILTGSAQFELMNNISQSLAGRTAILRLLPFSLSEIQKGYKKKYSIEEFLFNGFYPRIYDKKLNPTEALSFYVNTYLERDVRNLLNVKDLSKFETFIRLCAARTGQVLNYSNLGNDCGINHNTANHWLSILEASYIIFRLKPHFKNFSKRLIKSPKLYFYDVGLASYLIGIQSIDQLKFHPLRGSLFETMVVSELMKQRFNAVKESNCYYFRDNIGDEVDVLLDYSNKALPIEIKSGTTFNEDMLKGLKFYKKINHNIHSKPILIYAGRQSFVYKDYQIISIADLHKIPINP